jgi:hypothetical protein
MYIFACVHLRCMECRSGTSIFGCFVGLGAGPVLIFCFLGSFLACVCVTGQVGGGWRDSMIFPVFFLV